MRVLIINSAWFGGGAEAVARESYHYFTACGDDCYFAYARGHVPGNVKGIKIGNDLDVYTHAIMARLFDRAGFGSSYATKRFIEIIEKLAPEVICVHNLVCYAVNIEILFLYLRSCNKKIIWTLHDCWAFTGHCISFDDVNCDKWKKECGRCGGKHEYPKSIFLDRSKENLKKKKEIFKGITNLQLIVPSQWLANIVKETYLKEYNCTVIYNGIDLEKFKPIQSDIRERYGIGKNEIIILGVASKWHKRKGISYFNDLYEIINSQKIRIILIGVTEKEKRNLHRGIITVRRTESVDELAKWYTAADIFVNPSIADNFPTVNLEALACGTPVVTFDTGGSWEAIGEECGVLVTNKTALHLLEGINECLNRKISRNICVKHAKNFDKKLSYEKYRRLFMN